MNKQSYPLAGKLGKKTPVGKQTTSRAYIGYLMFLEENIKPLIRNVKENFQGSLRFTDSP